MIKMRKILYLFSILPIIGATWQDIIEKECDFLSNSGNFLKSGHSYEYRYHVTGNGAAVGTTDISSEIEIDCLVTLSAATSCLYNLELSNCKLSAKGGPEGISKHWIKDQSLNFLTQYPVLFSLNNGKLGTLFVHPEDSLVSVNIKRGIISGFALSPSSTNGEEKIHRDIHGNCPRKIFYENNRKISSSKDMQRCAFPSHPGWHLSPWSFFWNMSFIQYLINSSADCDYLLNVRQDEIESISCRERHAILLDSSQQTGNAVQTNIKYRLELESSSRKSFKQTYRLSEMRNTGIEFEYEDTSDPLIQSSNILNEVQEVLSDLVINSEDKIQLENIPKFHDFVTLLRKSCDLIPFIDSVVSCKFIKNIPRCNKLQKELSLEYLKDALVQCNTACCIKGIRHLIVRNQISQMYMNFIFISWSNIHIFKPAYIEEILTICKHTKMKLCWLTLGTAIYKYSQDHSEIPQPITEAVAYLSTYISNDCVIDDITFPSEYSTTDDKIEYLLTIIKTIGNIGDIARISNNDIIRQLYSCTIAKESTTEIAVAAIKAMFRMKPSNYMQTKLSYLMKHNTYSVAIRIAAYDILVHQFNDDELAQDIAILLREEKSTQIKCYLASDIQKMEDEKKSVSNRKSFLHRLHEKLRENKINLDDIHCNVFHHSQSNRRSSFFNLHFLPKEIQEFGAKIDQKMIFEALSALPYSSSLNYTTKLFNKYYNLFEYGISVKNWEEFGIWLRRQLADTDINYAHWLINNFVEIVRKLGIKGLIPVVSSYGSRTLSFVYPDQKVAENLRKLLRQFFQVNTKQKPSLEIYFKMFGNELGFISLNSIFTYFTKQYQWIANQDIVQSLHKGITYNFTRSMRLIEAYHLVPTMMGLPLNWTTNCTYIISPRIKIDANVSPGERTENFNIQYSEGFTLQNRMILDFPLVTQIGVQANTSMHTSLNYVFTLHHSDRRNLHEITFYKPKQEQKYVEFYRTNHQIEHGIYKEITDRKFERKNEIRCTSENFNEMLGLKFCHQKTYPKIPNEMKLSLFMAGKIEEKYIVQPYDKDLQYYKLQIFNPPTNDRNVYDFKLKFKAQGTKYTRETNIDLNFNVETKEGKFSVIIPELPDLTLSAARSIAYDEDEDETGIKHYWILHFSKDQKYEMNYKLKEKIESKIIPKGRGRATKEFVAKIRERTIDLKTPYNTFQWISKMNVQNHSAKVEALISVENLQNYRDWPFNPFHILPDSLMESDKKAWLQFESNLETTKINPEQMTRSIVNVIETPKRILKVITHRIQVPSHLKLNVNSTVTEKLSGNCLTFLNISYNGWKTGNRDHHRDIHVFDVEIPRYSWNLHFEKDSNDFKHSLALALSRIRLIPLNENGESYIGRWDSSQNDDFEVKKWDIKFEGQMTHKLLEDQLLPEKFRQTDYVYDKSQKFPGVETAIDISLKFPFENEAESLSIKGDILRVYKMLPTGSGVQWFDSEGSELSFTISNTINNFRKEIRVVTGSRQSWINKWISYNDVLYRGNDKRTEYNMNFLWGVKETCEYIDFEHKFVSSFFTFDSDFLFECKPESRAYHLEFNANSNSPEWDLLNVNVKKSFYMERNLEGWDTFNLNHPNLRIDAEGKTGMTSQEFYYDKKFSIRSQTDLIPNAEIKCHYKLLTASRNLELIIESPEEGLKSSNWIMDISNDGRKFSYIGTHILMKNPEKLYNRAKLLLKLVTPFKISVGGYEDVKSFFKFGRWLHSKGEILKARIHSMKRDRNHPAKQFIKSLKKITKREEEYFKRVYSQAGENINEILHLLHPFVEPTFEMISYMKEIAIIKLHDLSYNYEAFTVAGQILETLDHISIQEYMIDTLQNLPNGITEAIKANIASHDEYKIRYHYSGPHWMQWHNLLKLPHVWEGTWRNPIFKLFPQFHLENLFKSRYIVPPFYKTAMIFGPLHVYTFDGKMYEFPKYPQPDCMYMLLHDTRESSFSILTSETTIYLLFPEMTISIKPDRKIYVNNSQEESAVPIESSNGKVSVTREGEIIAVNTIGLKVVCDIQRMFCIFMLDPLHHSGIMGILGNADGEHFNDFMLPNGTTVQTAAELAQEYEVSNHKRCRQLQERLKPELTNDVHNQCSSVFTHYLSTCSLYLEINQNIFKEACYWDVSEGNNTCFSSDALAGYCTVNGMKTEPCSFKPKWYLKVVDSLHKLEVIIIMDQHYSMFSPGLKGFESLLGAVEDEFRSNGYSSILYSLIGFGGKGIREDPHIITPNINMWHVYKDIISMGQLLKFEGKKRSDALEAVKYATTILPFDMQSSKIILLFTVDDTDTSYSNLKVQYLHQLLESYAITLYTFADFPSIDKGKKVFGLRADGLIFPQSRRGESFLDFPKTEKAKLTSGTRGSIFLRKFAEANEPYAFYKIAAEEFYAKVRKEVLKTRKCDWTLTHWWDIQNRCHLGD